MDVLRLAYYPFLPEVRQWVAREGPDVVELLQDPLYRDVRQRGLERVQGAMEGGIAPVMVADERGALRELLSVAVARMLLALLGDPYLVRRYAGAEADRVLAVLEKDSDAAVERVAEVLELPVQSAHPWEMHVSEYLVHAPVREPEWKLIHQSMTAGTVALDRDRLVRLCREALRARIESDLEEERQKPVHDEVQDGLAEAVAILKPKLEEARQKWGDGDFGPVKTALFPPCIDDIFGQMAEGKLVPHHGRFAMASFLATIGMDSAAIMDYFRQIPNFDPEKSRYQIEHIAGERSVEKYTPPGCSWMQTNGVCPLEKRDNLCLKIKHPLSYYRARIRFQKEDEERGREMVAQAGVLKRSGGKGGQTGKGVNDAQGAGPKAGGGSIPRGGGAGRSSDEDKTRGPGAAAAGGDTSGRATRDRMREASR